MLVRGAALRRAAAARAIAVPATAAVRAERRGRHPGLAVAAAGWAVAGVGAGGGVDTWQDGQHPHCVNAQLAKSERPAEQAHPLLESQAEREEARGARGDGPGL